MIRGDQANDIQLHYINSPQAGEFRNSVHIINLKTARPPTREGRGMWSFDAAKNLDERE